MRGWNEIRSRISDSIREMKHAAPKGSGRRLSYMKRYFLKMLLLIIILVGVLVFMMHHEHQTSLKIHILCGKV